MNTDKFSVGCQMNNAKRDRNPLSIEKTIVSISVKLNLYAVAYRASDRNGQPSLDIWQEEVAIGSILPTLPLWLRGEICLPVDLATTYERTCREQRITVSSA